MNDPGLDDPIEETSKAFEQENAEEQGNRWWFASTAFPLLAGTFGPMASAFNICALIQSWRVSVPPGGTEEHGDPVPDPGWLIAVNALSLALAVVANLALLFNMARRLPFSIAQPITIIGWYISSFLLIGLIVAASYSLELPPDQERALTQAFYYAIMSAGLYIIVSTLMVITVYGAYKGHYPKEFKLTMSQRTLMLQTIAYLTYLLAGAAVFAHIEEWMFVDGVYWANYTLLTIGTGDYSPMTHLGKSLLFPFAIGGIIILGLVIGSIRSLVLDRGKRKLSSRMIEKNRVKLLLKMEKKGHKEVITPISKERSESPNGLTEQQRREKEFNIMRQVQNQATTRRRWISLGISGTAWLFLWLIGAVVFWIAESNQTWSYFDAIYFSYVSLLTIGYGDFRPMSNSGKAFFVFWALLAIPTLTILISNMGDTVVKGIRDLTLWLGGLTVLPGDDGVRQMMKQGAQKITKGKLLPNEMPVEEQPGGVGLAEGARKHEDIEKGGRGNGGKVERDAADMLASEFEDEELDEADMAKQRGDKIDEDIHYYHYLLVKEIRNVMNDLNQSPPRKYSYHEWAWFLRLMGEDENSSKSHRKPHAKETSKEGDGPQLQSAGTIKGDDERQQWSWLGARSPLMGETEEAEWVLERLTVTLERELKKQRENQRGEKTEKPIRMSREGGEDEAGMVPFSRGSSKTLDEDQTERRKSR